MNKWFYSKMAFNNIRKNKNIYLPYLLATSLVISLFYILVSVQNMVGKSGMIGTRTMTSILGVCVPISGIFALIILFYVNSFIMKQRKKEFGLYNILGMDKRNLGRLMVMEVLMIALISIFTGILAGALFSQLMFLVFYQLIHLEIKLQFTIPLDAVGSTFKLFGAGYLAVMVYDVLSVFRTNPIKIQQEARQGEREPKARWLAAVLGILSLGGGYYIAQAVESPMDALVWFFFAAILVIIGTYFLFIAGSIAILKLLRKRERFYYKPINFISVSGMIYRMKQNAVGLASICILSTMVMATMASCLSLFVGEEDVLNLEYPREIKITSLMYEDEGSTNPNEGKHPEALMKEAAREHGEKYGLQVKRELGYAAVDFTVYETGEGWDYMWGSDYAGSANFSTLIRIQCLNQADYEKNTGVALNLNEGEVAVAEEPEGILGDEFQMEELSYRVKEKVPFMEVSIPMGNGAFKRNVQLIFSSLEDMEKVNQVYERLYREVYGNDNGTSHPMYYAYLYDVEGETRDIGGFYQTMRDDFQIVPHLSLVNNVDAVREEFYQAYGSVMFVGIFLVAMFLTATVLIIYYKQITEGYDDRERFKIMQQVGLSSREVKSAIQRQVLQVFFLPLALAAIHMAVAYKSMMAMLQMFGMYNGTLYAWCVGLTAAVFGIFYFIVYEITAKTYYKIVKV